MPAITQRIEGKKARVGDFEVNRALPQVARRFVGPFCFVDHMRGEFTGPSSGVGPHPHIGLSTVTWLFEGEAIHRDSLGTEQRITPGEVNWMTAGRGIVHSERPPPGVTNGRMHGLQVWVALPADLEECEPSFQHVGAADLPKFEKEGVRVDVVLGTWNGLTSPVRLSSPLEYFVTTFEPGADLELGVPPAGHERALYVAEGNVSVEGTSYDAGSSLIASPDVSVCLSANTPARVAVFGGAPLESPRHLLWNFVSSRRERLQQAKEDWMAGRFPKVPGDDGPLIPFFSNG